ncbi:hypothetical protein PVT68_09050 [Microbulbifer bruguierae]|uniref:Uncharacterized protein n=1 Tax=Microbulbifer bruguierae TaxID=3029061 RepID=A0ABY8NHM6_9GAMM|nr:hypothetical protein [Microbulbifer bruguierae]WGL18428.1 hypothetical protein PVT68_09050 [Microbulbifer bruguierae]
MGKLPSGTFRFKLGYTFCISALVSTLLTACGGGSSGGGNSTGSSSGGSSSGGSSSGGNSAPSISSLVLDPVDAYANTHLTAQLSASDPDGDTLIESYAWYLNGELLEDEHSRHLNSQYFSYSDQLRVKATVTDPGGLSAEREATTVIKNSPPTISIASLSPNPAYTNTPLSLVLSAIDPDQQELTTTYHWSVNDVAVDGFDGATLPAEYFVKGDNVSVQVEVSDGQLSASETLALTISDAPPSFYISGAPDTAEYGVPVTFTVGAEDPDGEEVAFEFIAGPNGMNVDEDGIVTWTPTGPMFDTRQDVYWKMSLEQYGVSEFFTGTITVVDEDRLPPISRSGLVFENTSWQSFAAGDFSGNGSRELLVADNAQSLYTIAFDGSGYQQNWMYPFILEQGGKISCVTSGDIDNDQIDEIFVGINNSQNFGNEDSTRILILDGKSRRVRDTIDIQASLVTAIRIADVNNDDQKEIISLVRIDLYGDDEHRVEVRNSADFGVLWRSSALAEQQDIAVGDIDGDEINELVLPGGYVFGFNGSQFANEWLYGDGFGYQVKTTDIDGDQIDEIVGNSNSSSSPGLIVYDAVNKSIKGQISGKYSDFAASDVDGDNRSEILAIPYSAYKSTLYSFDTNTTSGFSINWELSIPRGANRGLIAELDGDGKYEYVMIDSDDSLLTVAGENPEIEVEWQNAHLYKIARSFRGGEQMQFNGKGNRLVFFAEARSSTETETMLGVRAIQMDPQGGGLEWSTPLANWLSSYSDSELVDLGVDGNPELYVLSDQTLSLYDFFSNSIVWSRSEYGQGVAKGRLDDDHEDVLAFLSERGDIRVYASGGQTLLSEVAGEAGKNILIADLDGDRTGEIITTSNQIISRYLLVDGSLTLVQQQTMENIAPALAEPEYVGDLQESYINTLTTGDLEGDGKQELVFTATYFPEYTWLVVLNHDLSPRTAYRFYGDIGNVQVQNYGTGRRNLLISSSTDLLNYTHSQILEIAPDSFTEVSKSPYLPLTIRHHGMQFVDTNNDGIPELSYSTYQSMNVTR